MDGSYLDAETVLRVVPAVSDVRAGWPFLAPDGIVAASQVLMARLPRVVEDVPMRLLELRIRRDHAC